MNGRKNMHGTTRKTITALIIGFSMMISTVQANANEETPNGGTAQGVTYSMVDPATGTIIGTTTAPLSPIGRNGSHHVGHEQEPSSATADTGDLALVKDVNDAAYTPVAQVSYVKSKQEKENICTASFVSKNVLLTSAHCLWDETGTITDPRSAITINKVMPKMNGEDKNAADGAPSPSFDVKDVYVPTSWTESTGVINTTPKDANNDYALISIKGEYDSWFGYEPMPLYFWGGYPDVQMAGYPNDKNKLPGGGLESRMWFATGSVVHSCYNPKDKDYAYCDDIPIMMTNLESHPGMSGAGLYRSTYSYEDSSDLTLWGVNKGTIVDPSVSTRPAELATRLTQESVSVINDVIDKNA